MPRAESKKQRHIGHIVGLVDVQRDRDVGADGDRLEHSGGGGCVDGEIVIGESDGVRRRVSWMRKIWRRD